MNRTFVTGAVVGIVAGVVVAGIVAFLLLGKAERNEVSFMLSTQSDGSCKATDPLPIQVKRHTPVKWNITNDCAGDPRFVKIDRTQEKNQNGNLNNEESDVISPYPATTSQAIPSRGTGQIDATVIKDHGGSKETYVYKYQISTGPAANGPWLLARDPDIETWDK